MAVNWGLANQNDGFDYLQSLQAIGNQAAQKQALAQRDYAFRQQQQQDQARPAIQQRAAAGDYAGAQAQAFTLGDYDALKYVSGLEATHHAKLATEADTIGRLATSLIGLPQEQRAAAFAAVAPQLKQAGFDDSELAGVQLTDGALQQYIKLATDTKDAIGAYNKQQEGYTLAQGSRRYVNGQMVAENPAEPRYQAVPEGGMLVRVDGGSATPVYGAPSGGVPAGGGGAVSGRTQYGWTPRARNGGDNTDAAVDGKLQGMSQALRIPVDGDISGMDPMMIARALSLSEGGPGSLADRNNNPGNLTDARTGAYRKFGSKEEGLRAAAAQVRRNLARGQTTIRTMVEGLPVGGGQRGGSPDVIVGRPKQTAAPSGYRYNGDRLEPIPGGPADPNTSTQRNVQSNRTAEANYRKEFDNLPEVKTFKTARQQFNTLRDLGTKKNPTPQDDIALIFSYMKTLDPSSVVREGEFAQAQNAAGVPDGIRNMYNKALSGNRLNPDQRQNMVRTAYRNYANYRAAYNQAAENYRGYARDNGINPDRVARTYTPDKPQPKADRMSQFKIVRVR